MSEIGSRQFVAQRRGTSRICLLSPLSRDERGSGGGVAGPGSNWRDGYASSGWRQPFAYQLHARWLQSSCHPSTRSSTCGLPSRAYRASPTIFFPLFHPSRRIRFVSTSCPIPLVVSPLRLFPSFLLAIILRSLGIR